MSEVLRQTERIGRDGDPTAGAPDFIALRSITRGGGRGFRKKKTNSPARGFQPKQSFELAAGAARSWVDPRGSLEISGRESARELSCLERGQALNRTEVR